MPAVSTPIAPVGCNFKVLTASGVVKADSGTLAMVFVSSSSSLNIKVWDNASAASGTAVIDSVLVDAKEHYYWPAAVANGIYVQFVSGTGAITVFYI